MSIGPQFRTYLFDHVFDSAAASDSQAEVYSVLVKPLIARAFEGYDCTFLAIGQTGSGKTYTVGFDQSVSAIAIFNLFVQLTDREDFQFRIFFTVLCR